MLMEGSVYSAGAANLLSKRPLSVNDDGELLLAAGFPAATSLFGCLVTRGSPTYTGTLQVTLGIDQD